MTLREAWERRAPGERRLYAGIAAAAALVLVFAFAWLPLERERARLERDLPALRGSIARLEREAQEVKRLRATPAATPRAATPLASLATNAGGLPGARVNVLDERRVRVSGDDVGFAALLDWLRAAQASHGMRVETAHIEALPAAGRVRVDLLLAKG